jgi:hypothetical protein
MTQIGLAVLGVWMLVRVLRGQTPVWAVPAAAGLWLVGGVLFWYVAFLEYQRTGNMAATLESAFLGGWGAAVFNVSGLGTMLVRSVLMGALNFPTPLALLGLYGIWRSRRLLAGTPLAAVLGGAMVLYLLFAMRYRVPNQNHFFTPVYLLLAVYIGLGVHATGWLRKRVGRVALAALAMAVVPAYWAVAEVTRAAKFNPRDGGAIHEIPYRDFYAYYFMPWQCGQTGPRRFAEEVLASLPEGAILLPDTTTAPPLKCLHDVEHVRPDVLIVDPYDAQFDPLLRGYWQGAEAPPNLTRDGRRVFVNSNDPAYLPQWAGKHWRLKPHGCIWELEPELKESGP